MFAGIPNFHEFYSEEKAVDCMRLLNEIICNVPTNPHPTYSNYYYLYFFSLFYFFLFFVFSVLKNYLLHYSEYLKV